MNGKKVIFLTSCFLTIVIGFYFYFDINKSYSSNTIVSMIIEKNDYNLTRGINNCYISENANRHEKKYGCKLGYIAFELFKRDELNDKNLAILEKASFDIKNDSTFYFLIFYYLGSDYSNNNLKKINFLYTKGFLPYVLIEGKSCYVDEGSIFHLYIIKNDISGMEHIVKNKLIDLSKKYCSYSTPILQQVDDYDIFKLLIDNGANISDKNFMGVSTLTKLSNMVKSGGNNQNDILEIKKKINLLKKKSALDSGNGRSFDKQIEDGINNLP